MGWLAQSRQVLEINDIGKLYNLLAEQKAELSKLSTTFGATKGRGINPTHKKSMKSMPSQYRKTKKNIARIMTRINQIKQKDDQKR